ncbi:FecR family protein [Hyphomonas atlantica corrig.]|uniref:FecR family protein n=1 Tax=Hyphomonas atlantica TaxID=1280948 RepID=UPI00235795C2|nr:FecR domain-containing protein [Hyphomonas atlantica]|tara:strand:- start:1788 stop:2786 length:999 start_codon:yes stop_codon:yes gene_type:complete
MKKPVKPDSSLKPVSGSALDAEAHAWVLYFASGENAPEKQKLFADWLAGNPDRRVAFERAGQLWDAMADVEDVENILTDQNNIETFQPRRRMSRRILLGGGLAASLVCAVGIGSLTLQQVPPEMIELSTPIGEIKTFTLSDGSEITLGGASQVRGEFSATTRNLELVGGNAYFDITRSKDRPLTVDTGSVRVQVLGTRFSIKKRTEQVAVSVDSGHVRVMTDMAARDLRAGDRIVSSAALRLGPVEPFDAERELSWRSGRLTFVDAPLHDIVADINQYSGRPVRLAPSAPADMRLTLSFSVKQIDQVLAGLDAAYPIEVRENDTEIVISQGR